MSKIPAGGYSNPAPDVKQALLEFNRQFATVLASLRSAWSNGTVSDLTAAAVTMSRLQNLGTAIMQLDIPGGSGTYGPDFILP
jgi:hypothetical protein